MALTDRLTAPKYYDLDAAGYAARYDSVSFESVHPLLSRYLPSTGLALDIGAGSGRDARAMSVYGLEVIAVEPSEGLRAIGQANSSGVHWIDDHLPRLGSLIRTAERFDYILCSAVLMLIAPSDLTGSFITMAKLLGDGGRLGVNLRAPLSCEPAELFFDHSDAGVLQAAEAAGLVCVDRGEADDAIGRGGYRWRSFVFLRKSVAHRDEGPNYP
jgi:SAM-dependent methyltransferase